MSSINRWLQQRREARALRAERSGDSPEKQSERAHAEREPTVEEAAQQASVGLTSNSAPFQG